MNELLDKLVSAIADEVQKKLPQPKDVSAEELKQSIHMMLQEADWFKQLVQGTVQDNLSMDEIVRDAAREFTSNFDITDFREDIESMAEGVLEEHDFTHTIEDAVKEAVSNYDFRDVVESALDDVDISGIAKAAAEVSTEDMAQDIDDIKTRVEQFDALLKALVNVALEYTTKQENK